jgi:hypothetical protein
MEIINLNPTAPMIRGLIKTRKGVSPIRPIVNWKKRPSLQTNQNAGQKTQDSHSPPIHL